MTTESELDAYFILEEEGGTARPATLSDENGNEIGEINVNFMRPNQNSAMGGMPVENYEPKCNAKTSQCSALNTHCRIAVHYGYLLDEDEQPILDEYGEPIIAENEFTYYIKALYPDSEGITTMHLTLDQPN